MARIAGVDLPRDKRVDIGLTYIYGIGLHTSKTVLNKVNVDHDKKVRNLTSDDIVKLRAVIEQDCTVEGDLRKFISLNIKRLMDLGCYRGLRHRMGLPVHGQRTKTNARVRKGKKPSVGGKKRN